MRYFLDTNICIYQLNGQYPSIDEHIDLVGYENVKLPAVAAAELYHGAIKSARRDYNLIRYNKLIASMEIIPFSLDTAKHYGELRAALEVIGKPIGGNDMLIAATALAHGATLVTHNVGEFSRVPGLLVEDWTQ